MNKRVLVAGIGNIFLGDDAFGVEVVRQLAGEELPADVCVADFGIRGMDLAYALLDPWKSVLFVDAIQRGGPPGTLYLLEPELPEANPPMFPEFDAHTMDPFKVLQLAAALGAPRHVLRLMGCEPSAIPAETQGEAYMEMTDGLSAPVHRAVPQAVARIKRLLNALLEAPAVLVS